MYSVQKLFSSMVDLWDNLVENLHFIFKITGRHAVLLMVSALSCANKQVLAN